MSELAKLAIIFGMVFVFMVLPFVWLNSGDIED